MIIHIGCLYKDKILQKPQTSAPIGPTYSWVIRPRDLKHSRRGGCENSPGQWQGEEGGLAVKEAGREEYEEWILFWGGGGGRAGMEEERKDMRAEIGEDKIRERGSIGTSTGGGKCRACECLRRIRKRQLYVLTQSNHLITHLI